MKIIRRCFSLSLLLLLAVNAVYATPSGTLIQGASVIDGTGADPVQVNVRIVGDRIVGLGDMGAEPGDTVVDASGLILAPGFIDTHSHHDRGLQHNRDASAAISQGITSIVVGMDGYSEQQAGELKQSLARSPVAVNVATFTGHGGVRAQVMGSDYKRLATAKELLAMQALVEQDLADGSLGLSTGLEYDPGIYASTEEVIALAGRVGQLGGRYVSHMRSEDRAFYEALDELLLIGEKAEVPVHISHIKLASVDLWGQAAAVLARLDKARASGIDVTADIYPYNYWEATLTVLLPERDFEDIEAAQYALEKLAPADGLTLTRYDADPSLVGKTVADIARERRAGEAQTYLALINAAYPPGTEEVIGKRDQVMGVSMAEEDIAVLMAWPHSNICSDGGFKGHPRGHGAFPRVLRRYALEQQVTSLPEMIRKMTSLSASHVGLSERGKIAPGYYADLVLFSERDIADHAGIGNASALSSGVEGVWVNGVRVWQGKQPTGDYPGRFISGSNKDYLEGGQQ